MSHLASGPAISDFRIGVLTNPMSSFPLHGHPGKTHVKDVDLISYRQHEFVIIMKVVLSTEMCNPTSCIFSELNHAVG